MAVIELAKPGLEATTYELIVTVGNAALTLNGIIATQLLTPMKAVGCDDDTGNCSPNTVDVTGKSGFDSTDGPNRFTNYTLVLTAISLTACYLFTRFLPASKEECHLWRLKGEEQGDSVIRGRLAFGMAVLIVGVSVLDFPIFLPYDRSCANFLFLRVLLCVVQYGVIAAILLLDVDTACQPAIGGSGC